MCLENITTYSEICAGNQIIHCRTVACNFSKDNLFDWQMNYLNSSSDYNNEVVIYVTHSTLHPLSKILKNVVKSGCF